jgi:basic amino acid/polyamine antiporter, APA family
MRDHIELATSLTLFDGFMLVVGNVIGAGIFLAPMFIATHLPSLSGVVLAWFIGGLLSVFGALSVAELGALYPNAGGLYVYLAKAYGKPMAFIYGWSLFTLIHTGSIATLATGFSYYLARLIPLTFVEQKAAAITSIVVLSGVSISGIRSPKVVQNVVTIGKVGGVVLLALLLFWRGNLHQISRSWLPRAPVRIDVVGFGIALVAVLWAYEGWHVVSFIAAEFRMPSRDLPRSLLAGTMACFIMYLAANLAYYSVLPAALIMTSPDAAATAVQVAYGSGAMICISFLIVTSIFGGMNSMVLTGPRVYYAMAQDGMFFRKCAELHRRTRVPVFAIIAQGVWASFLCVIGTFEQLFTYVIFAAWVFYGLTVAGVLILRGRKPDLVRPYRVPGYPWIPIVFCCGAAVVTVNAFVSNFRHAAIGVVLILSSVPAFYLFRAQTTSEQSDAVNEAQP